MADEKPEALSEEQSSVLDKLLSRIKDVLGEPVTEVKGVAAAYRFAGLSGQSGRQRGPRPWTRSCAWVSKDTSIPKKVLEINPDHPLVRNMITIFEKDENDPFIDQAANQLFESALLLEGYLTDPHALVGRVQELLTKSSGWYVETRK